MKQLFGKNVLALFFLGICSGLPLLLVFGTLSVWLREADIERSTIGFLSWAGLSYAFKFVWAPAVDHLSLPILTRLFGRRRSWILLSQSFIIAALLWMSFWDPQFNQVSLFALAAGAVMLGFASATQDIVIDAYRIDIADNDQQTLLAGVAIAGYRIGMLFAGAGALELSELFNHSEGYSAASWQLAYQCMAIFMLIGIVTTLVMREPHTPQARVVIHNNLKLFLHFILVITSFVICFFALGLVIDNFLSPLANITYSWLDFLLACLRMLVSVATAILVGNRLCYFGFLESQEFHAVYVSPFTDFFTRYGQMAIWLLLIICFYRTSDIVMGVMAKVFYVDMGYSKTEISRISFIFGTLVSLVGGILGGIFAYRYGIMKILLLGALTASTSNLLFIYLASLSEPSTTALTLAIVADNLAGGLAGGVAVAFLSSLVNRQFSATQYAAFSAITLLFPKLLAGYSGTFIDALGYQYFFALTALMGLPVILLIIYIWRPYKNTTNMS
jgi:PAT family beta-lactamase induction signal transducer AmpG